jgi:hypothetical protein
MLDENGPVTANIDLLLITGAGASTAFGNDRRPLAMMPEFNDAILKLLQGKPGFQDATGLKVGLEGHEFERRLGIFLQAWRAYQQIGPILNATAAFPGALVDEAKLKQWFEESKFHFREVVRDIYRVTYEEFSPDRVAITSAQAAFQTLLEALGMVRLQDRIVVATTNYDLVADDALEGIGWLTDNGTRRPGAVVHVGGLVDSGKRTVPVLHLHGCLGWYRHSDSDEPPYSTDNRSRYEPAHGDPVVLLPEMNKSYGGDALVRSLWDQFDEALQAARRVLVIGHSLQDRELVSRLAAHVQPPSRIGVIIFPDPPEDNPVSTVVRTDLAGAAEIRLRFADPLDAGSGSAVEQWHSKTYSMAPRV